MLSVLVLVAYKLLGFPFHPLLIGLVLITYGAFVWEWPPLLLIAIPALLPIVNFAQWSGRFYFDVFDMLVLVSLAVGYARVPSTSRRNAHDILFLISTALVALAYVIGVWRGGFPWPVPDVNSFTSYYSHYNALRIAKGALWAFFLLELLRRFLAQGHDIRRLFAAGMSIGLAGTVAVVVWERVAFPGLLNFASDYRVTGPFSEMHTGGAEIECYLVTALPFLAMLFFQARSNAVRFLCVALLLGATYAVAVTFSRDGYFGYAIALTTICSVAAIRSPGHRRRIAPYIPIALALFVAIPLSGTPFVRARMAKIAKDLRVRYAHWDEALRIRDAGWTTDVLGMGIGRYPDTHYWRSSERHAAAYRFVKMSGNIFVSLGSGANLYFEQVVRMKPHHLYYLDFDALSKQSNARLNIAICEKWLLTSLNCIRRVVKLTHSAGTWKHFRERIQSGDLGEDRPVKLAFFNGGKHTVVAVDNVSLKSRNGRNLIANGDFSHDLDHWFFSIDSDLPWHIWSLPVTLLFAQGWLGLLAVSALTILALLRTARDARTGDLGAGTLLASLLGFLVIGAGASLIDSPRFLLLYLLLIWLACLRPNISKLRTDLVK